ncbi:MAG: HAD family hydrolase, partial [Lachnospiraceae bacterium]|nr:HAD family hydrolase [Lachnospiraceae bacterium]
MDQNNLFDTIENLDTKPKAVAFDFFDTLVHRNCHPEVILYKWAKIIAGLNGNSFSAEYIYALRKEKEIKGKKIFGKEEITYEELIKLVFDDLSSKYTLKYDADEFLSVSYKTECELEKEAITFDEECLKCIKELQKEFRIFIVSDFYMGKDFFVQILKDAGVSELFDDIYVSSDVSFRKSSGKLYDYVISKLSVDNKELCMVGDNRSSDYDIPVKMGIQAIHRPYSVNYRHYGSHKETESACRSLLNSKRNIYFGYIPELYFFISKLYDELDKNNVKKAYFLSREGQLLKTLFGKYQKSLFGEEKIESEYMFVSRKATLLPALKEIDSENFDIIFRQYTGLSAEQFLKNIGMPDDIIKKVLNECQISEDDIVESADCDIMQKIKSNALFREKYAMLVKEQKELFLQYINGIGIKDSEELTVVDVGWKGTIQDNLSEILPDKKIKGYYLGIS